MDRDPDPGVTVGGVHLDRELAAAIGNGLYSGTSRAGLPMLVTVGMRQERPLDVVRAELGYALAGVAPFVAVVEDVSPSVAWHVLVEERPPGAAVVELVPVSERTAIAWLTDLAGVVEAAHARGVVLYGIHPRLCFARPGGAWSGIAPRALPFLFGMSPGRGGLCLDELYLPFEVWRDRKATPGADVFALCALGQFLVTGKHPFAAETFHESVAAAARGERERVASPLGALLDRGLAVDPAQRPTASEVRAALRLL